MSLEKSSTFWDSEVNVPTHVSWLAEPEVRRYVNYAITGDPDVWPLNALKTYVGDRVFRRGLSIGCGTGALERALIDTSLCLEVDAFDGSIGSLAIARREATDHGSGSQIHYFASDFNVPVLPKSLYDAVFVHQALHHVSSLEKLYLSISEGLISDGVLYFDEYVGPSRDDWNHRLLRFHQSILDELPPELKLVKQLALPIQADDPSEAVRSSSIIPQLQKGFEVVERRDYGGAVLSVLYPAIDWSKADAEVLRWLIDKDRTELEKGHSYHAVILARPKKGWRHNAGKVHYVVGKKYYMLRTKLRGLRFRVRRAVRGVRARW